MDRDLIVVTILLRLHTCCPRQILGPALNGQKMKGLGIRNLWSLSSRNRSGSNLSAKNKKASGICKWILVENCLTIRSPQISPPLHNEDTVHAAVRKSEETEPS